jgi:hypothetical protein
VAESVITHCVLLTARLANWNCSKATHVKTVLIPTMTLLHWLYNTPRYGMETELLKFFIAVINCCKKMFVLTLTSRVCTDRFRSSSSTIWWTVQRRWIAISETSPDNDLCATVAESAAAKRRLLQQDG